jgi:hypothetical protein
MLFIQLFGIWRIRHIIYQQLKSKKGPIICNITYIENQEHSIAFDSTC